MRTLYHLKTSPFSRRARLALAQKGLDVDLRDGRENPAFIEEARRLVPFRTLPVLIDGDRAMGDSTAIAHWLDRAYPEAPRLWPQGAQADASLQVATLVDVVLNHLIDLGTRYYALREHPAWDAVRGEMVGRAQRAADALAERVGERLARLGRASERTIDPSGWSAADMWLYTMVAWLESLPARKTSSPIVAQILTLGFTLPGSLASWADAHRDREDVRALS